MKTLHLAGLALMTIFISACAVMPKHIMDEALPDVDFKELTTNVDRYVGQTVILGGYVLSVENFEDRSHMIALQTPLGTGQQPKSKDRSQGRMTLIYDGFLDAEVYAKDRRITVGGRILEPAGDESQPFPHIRLAVREIHLWPVVLRYDATYPYGWNYYYWDRHYPWYHHRRHYWW